MCLKKICYIALPVKKEFNGIFLVFLNTWTRCCFIEAAGKVWGFQRSGSDSAALSSSRLSHWKVLFSWWKAKWFLQAPKVTVNAVRRPLSLHICDVLLALRTGLGHSLVSSMKRLSVHICCYCVNNTQATLQFNVSNVCWQLPKELWFQFHTALNKKPLTGFCDTQQSISNSTGKSGISSDLPYIPTDGEMYGIVWGINAPWRKHLASKSYVLSVSQSIFFKNTWFKHIQNSTIIHFWNVLRIETCLRKIIIILNADIWTVT